MKSHRIEAQKSDNKPVELLADTVKIAVDRGDGFTTTVVLDVDGAITVSALDAKGELVGALAVDPDDLEVTALDVV